MDIGIQEIFGCHDWAIEPVAGRQLYNALMSAIANHRDGIDGEGKMKTMGYFISMKKSQAAKAAGDMEAGKLYVGDIRRIENRLYWRDEELAEDDQIVNVVVIEGAVTRNGGACTYGSKDHRDQILYANTIPQVVGHLFLINTPGGMTAAAPDYTMAIENCRALKKPTVSLIDGMCYSMGEWIACQTDYVIAMNPEDGFGCIGTMAIGQLAPHGSVNAITQERLFILVGKGSPDKNREAIEASQGNDKLMQEEADKGTEHFREVVKANRPAVTDDLLTGKTFKAHEVMGRLVDEIGDMSRAIEAVFQLADGTLTPARDVEVVPGEPKPEDSDDDAAQETATNINPQNENNMTEEEMKAQEAAAAEAPQTTKTPAQESPAQEEQESTENAEKTEGTETPATEEAPATEEQSAEEEAPATETPAADAEGVVTETPAAAQAELTKVAETLHSAEAMIAEKDKTIAELKESLSTMEGAIEERDAANALVSERDKTIEENAAVIAERDKTIAEHVATIAAKDATIEKLTKQVADLRSEVKELSEKPTPMVTAESGVPADNGTGEAPKTEKPRITSDMSYEEILAFKRAQREAAKKK